MPGPLCGSRLAEECGVTKPVQTPEWVKDAVFYQIFHDRFAKKNRIDKPTNDE